jgi:hypothetical protein
MHEETRLTFWKAWVVAHNKTYMEEAEIKDLKMTERTISIKVMMAKWACTMILVIRD